MKANETQSNEKSNQRPFEKVFDRQRRRVRGLWLRDGTYYAQLAVAGQTKRIALQAAQTVSEAVSARQALKDKIASGAYKSEQSKKAAPETSTGIDHSIKAAIAGYRSTRDKLGGLDPATGAREDSGLTAWIKFSEANKLTSLDDIDTKACLDFAEWRRDRAWEILKAKRIAKGELAPKRSEPEELLSGRTLDLNVQAIEKVRGWGLTRKWITTKPEIAWDTLADEPDDVRLLTGEELDALCNANLVKQAELDALPLRMRHLRARQAPRAQLFSDYLRLIFLTGAREAETLVQKWTYVTWSKGERGHIYFPGKNAKAGGGKAAEDRNVDFHSKLEKHLQQMYERRDKSTDWMFPSFYDPQQPIKSFKKQLEHAKETCGPDFSDVGFHHGRHFFISWAVAKGIDFKQIAIWVSHRGTVLIGRKYSHLVPGHGKDSAAKLDTAFKLSSCRRPWVQRQILLPLRAPKSA